AAAAGVPGRRQQGPATGLTGAGTGPNRDHDRAGPGHAAGTMRVRRRRPPVTDPDPAFDLGLDDSGFRLPSRFSPRGAPHPRAAREPLPPVDLPALLQEVFGYAAFRGHQREIVDHVTAGGDALVLMPTGGGKSLCYQVPAIARHRAGRGVTLVVSPL